MELGHLDQPGGRLVRTDQERGSGVPVEEGGNQYHENHHYAQTDPTGGFHIRCSFEEDSC